MTGEFSPIALDQDEVVPDYQRRWRRITEDAVTDGIHSESPPAQEWVYYASDSDEPTHMVTPEPSSE